MKSGSPDTHVPPVNRTCKRKTNFRMLALILPGIAVMSVDTAVAASSCYEDRFYPAVARLEPTADGFRAVAGGRHHDREAEVAPVVAYDAGMGWEEGWSRAGETSCGKWNCIDVTQGCDVEIPNIELSPERAQRLRGWGRPRQINQEVYACTEHDGAVYFGIGFYAGEGYNGVGGIGRYVPETGEMEIRRPTALISTPVTRIAFDGRELWIATAGDYECSGMPPTEGLIRYDWESGRLEKESHGSGLCGFVIHDLLLTPDALWVATDLGLSQKERGDPDEDYWYDEYGWSGGWRDFVPDPDADGGMRHVSCDTLYKELLDDLPLDGEPAAPRPYDQTVRSILRFKPRWIVRHMRTHRAPSAPADDTETESTSTASE